MGSASFGALLSIFLLSLSALFSFAETCLTTCNKNKIIRKSENGNKKAKIVLKLLEKKDRMVSAILFGNTLINVLMSSIVTNEFIGKFGENYIVLLSFAITIIILIFAEVLPKNLALLNPEKSSMRIASIINFTIKIFYPITFILQVIVSSVFRIFGLKFDNNKNSFIGDIKDLVAAYKSENDEKIHDSLKMISGVSSIDSIKLGQAMIHRTNVVIIDVDENSIDEIMNKALNCLYSRIPICKGEDNIIGILSVKDLSQYIFKNKKITKEDFISILRKPTFVYENTSLSVQLNKFRKDHRHMGIVVDEYSVFLGIITLEDIIEKIVGAIYDEYDDTKNISQTHDDIDAVEELEVDGTTLLHDLVRNHNLNINNHENYTTIAGFIIEKIERIPEENEEIEIENYIFIIKEILNNKINLVIIKKKKNH